MVVANGLIVINEDQTRIKKGDLVTVQLLDDSLWWSETLPF